jgi:hypothetical protein
LSPSSTFRYGGGAAGGQGSTVDLFIALNDPTSASNLPAFPSVIAGCSDPLCGFINTGILPPVTPVTPQIVSQPVTIRRPKAISRSRRGRRWRPPR